MGIEYTNNFFFLNFSLFFIASVTFQSFRPPFAIDSEKFNFTPRIQKLNQIDALTRARLIFDAQLASYWHMQGHTFEVPNIDNKYVDFYDLYKVCDTCKRYPLFLLRLRGIWSIL